jgi:hypothetical protein
MPTLTCPRCGNSGAIRGGDDCFDCVWPTTRGHFPVRKCRKCGAGIIVRPKLLWGTRPTLIPDDTWRRMEQTFAPAAVGAAIADEPFVCGECGDGFTSESALETHARDAHVA